MQLCSRPPPQKKTPHSKDHPCTRTASNTCPELILGHDPFGPTTVEKGSCSHDQTSPNLKLLPIPQEVDA